MIGVELRKVFSKYLEIFLNYIEFYKNFNNNFRVLANLSKLYGTFTSKFEFRLSEIIFHAVSILNNLSNRFLLALI